MAEIFSFFGVLYGQFLGFFPPQVHWLISLVLIILIIATFIVFVRFHWLATIVLILLFPILWPIVKNFFLEVYHFILPIINYIQANPNIKSVK